MTISRHDLKPDAGSNARGGLSTRMLDFADIPAMMALAYDSAVESGVAERYCARHSRAHFAGLLIRGVGIGVCDGSDVIGLALFAPIDAGFAVLEDMESAHIFIRSDRRSIEVARMMFRAIRRLAQETGHTLLVHQVAYFDALSGRRTQTERVERLYKRMRLDGSYGITYVCRPEPDEI